MAIANLHGGTAPATQTFRARMLAHNVNGVRELCDDPADAAIQITKHLHGLTAYLAAALPERENTHYHVGERPIDRLNPEITGAAFDGLSYLAGLANFFACEAACDYGADK